MGRCLGSILSNEVVDQHIPPGHCGTHPKDSDVSSARRRMQTKGCVRTVFGYGMDL
jgi:hypothetical protein